MLVSVEKLYFNNKRSNHLIEDSTLHRTSLSSYLMLKQSYIIKNKRDLPYLTRNWLRFRNKLLNRMKKENNGKLKCYYCNKSNLTANHNNPNKINYDGLATIDHYIPKALLGKVFDEDNLVCACSSCNGKKKDLHPRDFFLLIKNISRHKNSQFYKRITNENIRALD